MPEQTQVDTRVAFLGPLGTFSQTAALNHFGPSTTFISTKNIDGVFQLVESDQVDFGIVPIENSTEGVVNATLDSLINRKVKICGEVMLPIHLHVLVDPGDKTPIERIYSHPQPLGQARKWLGDNFANIESIPVASNATAAQKAKQEAGAAAIAGQQAAEQYGLKILHKNIEDNPDNTTRFLIIGENDCTASGDDKTSLLIWTSNIPGAILRIAQPFANHNVNITLPTSRPTGEEKWSYIFFIEIEGHHADQHIQQALRELEEYHSQLRILGSYPKAAS